MRLMLREKSITFSSKTTLSWFVLRHITILTYCVCPTVQCFKIVIVPNEVYAEFLCVKTNYFEANGNLLYLSNSSVSQKSHKCVKCQMPSFASCLSPYS